MKVLKSIFVLSVIAWVESASKETEATVESTLEALITRVETLEDVVAEQAETINQQAELIKNLGSESSRTGEFLNYLRCKVNRKALIRNKYNHIPLLIPKGKERHTQNFITVQERHAQ